MLFLCWEAKVPAVLSPSLCHPSASPLSLSPSAHLRCATVNPLPILSHTGHMSLERIYYTISSFRKSCKEAGRGDKALRVKSSFFPTGPKEKSFYRGLKCICGASYWVQRGLVLVEYVFWSPQVFFLNFTVSLTFPPGIHITVVFNAKFTVTV